MSRHVLCRETRKEFKHFLVLLPLEATFFVGAFEDYTVDIRQIQEAESN
jgi:hypothetical protein